MKKFNYEAGKVGERIAADFLIKKGYKVVERNFRTRYGEIDLVCINQKKIVFVEVKLKVGDQFGSPEEMINRRKIIQVQRTAEAYLQQNPKISQEFSSLRIEAICIVLGQDNCLERINHYENLGSEI